MRAGGNQKVIACVAELDVRVGDKSDDKTQTHRRNRSTNHRRSASLFGPTNPMLLTLALTATTAHISTAAVIDRRTALSSQPNTLIGATLLRLRGGVDSERGCLASEAMRTWATDDVGEAERIASFAQPTTRSLEEEPSRSSLTLRPPPSFTIDKLPQTLHRLRGGQSSGAQRKDRSKVPLLRRVAQSLAGDRAEAEHEQMYLHPTLCILVSPSSDPDGELMPEAELVGR